MILLYKNWNLELIESSRAKIYVLFCNFRLQPHLTCITLENFMISLSCLRMSSHRSKVETLDGKNLQLFHLIKEDVHCV